LNTKDKRPLIHFLASDSKDLEKQHFSAKAAQFRQLIHVRSSNSLLLHTFCGQQCAQSSMHLGKLLISKNNQPAARILSSAQASSTAEFYTDFVDNFVGYPRGLAGSA
jgi:hypothetical protein